jgi:integrase
MSNGVLYRAGMPLALLSEWMGHSQLETTMIYAYADTEMKCTAIEKATSTQNPLKTDMVVPAWHNNE